MNKKDYLAPEMEVFSVEIHAMLQEGSPGSGVHTDDPQSPGNAMTKERDGVLNGEDFDWDVDF